MKLETLVSQSINGDKTALEGVVTAVQDDIYYLSLRMLANPEDAKDATQEILIKVITKLSTFESKSQFKTWVYRVATNYLLSEKKVLNKDHGLTFDMYKADLESDLQDAGALKNLPEYSTMLNELRVSCTMAMLLCLNHAHRMAYILGDIFEMDHQEASDVLSISKGNFRKQLSRARAKIVEFTSQSCGLVNDCAKCHCEKKLHGAIKRKRVDRGNLYFADNEKISYLELKENLQETQSNLKTLKLQSIVSMHKSPVQFSEVIESLVNEGIKPKPMDC